MLLPKNAQAAPIYFGLDCFVTCCFVFFARRHLMVWRVFAPKFVFDTLISVFVWVVALLGWWLM
jgi:hypothetical protein